MRYSIGYVFGEVDSLPGCSQIAVSHSVFTPKEFRGTGEGTRAGRIKDNNLFQFYGYDYALCTVASSNETEKRSLIQRGWKRLDNFMSRKTDHPVEIWGKSLNETGQRVEPI